MKLRLLLAPAVLVLGMGLAACDDDNGDAEISGDEVRGELQDIADSIRDGSQDLADDIDQQLDDTDLSEIDDNVREQWNENCQQLSESAENEDAGSELTDVCGDLREGLENNDGEAVDDARERLRDFADETEDDIDTVGDDSNDDNP